MAEDDGYTKDGTVDYCGNPANKKETGTWRACPFILGNFFWCFLSPRWDDMCMNCVVCEIFIILSFYLQEMNVVRDWLIMG